MSHIAHSISGVDRHEDSITSNLCKTLTEMLALLQAQRWNYQLVHWQVAGDSQYGDHLLFQRLYEGMDAEIDALAEKTIGLVQLDSVGQYAFDGVSQAERMQAWLLSWAAHACPLQRSLQSEKDFQRVWSESYKSLKVSGGMTLGLDDWIMSTASAHETNAYLLQQRVAKQGSLRQASQSLVRSWFSRTSAGRKVVADDLEDD
jgi:hypothetical protein